MLETIFKRPVHRARVPQGSTVGRSVRGLGERVPGVGRVLVAVLLSVTCLSCNSSDDETTRTGSESHFIRCVVTDDCERGICTDGYCEVDGERITTESLEEQQGAEPSRDSGSEASSAPSDAALETSPEASSSPSQQGSDSPPLSSESPMDEEESAPSAEDPDAGMLSGDTPQPTEAMSSSPSSSPSPSSSTPSTTVDAGTAVQELSAIQAGTPCPSSPPAVGADCVEVGLACTYGDDPRGYRCRTQAVCTFDGWRIGDPECAAAEALGACPAAPAELHGTSCQELEQHCVSDDVRCKCGPCTVVTGSICEGGLCDGTSEVVCGAELNWYCDVQGQPECPPDPANVGTACDDETEPFCHYFDPSCGTNTSTSCLRGRRGGTSPMGFGAACDERFVELEEFCPEQPPEPSSECSAAFRGSVNLGCTYGCERLGCAGYAWAVSVPNTAECTDCGEAGAMCTLFGDCCDGFECAGTGCRPAPVCGNGALEGGEICDDGNTANGDGCAADCSRVEPDFN